MKNRILAFAFVASALFVAPAAAQIGPGAGVVQQGAVVANHTACWDRSGVIKDCGAGGSGLVVGVTTITGGTNLRVLANNAGVLGEYATTGTGVVAMNTSPTFVTPALGAATATTLVVGGGLLGPNALAVTGNIAGTAIFTASTGQFGIGARSTIYSGADGNIVLGNSAQSDFSLLQFGGTNSAFPALKRSSASIQIRLADDSNYAPLAASAYSVGATVGASCGPITVVTSLTVVNGIVTACGGT